jgi:FtsH-binding integral membrane protein
MFHGTVNIMRSALQKKANVWAWMLGSLLVACLAAYAVHYLNANVVAEEWRRTVTRVTIVVVATGMGAVLFFLIKPRPQPVDMTADHNGVFADGVPLVLRQDILQAYIRPAFDERTMLTGSPGRQIVMRIPGNPLTVEIIRRKGGQLNLDPGGEQAAAALLTALGIPVTMCAPDYRGNLRPKRSQTLSTVVIVIVFLAALFGFSYWKSTGH